MIVSTTPTTAAAIRLIGEAVIALADAIAHAEAVQYDAPAAPSAVENDRRPAGGVRRPTEHTATSWPTSPRSHRRHLWRGHGRRHHRPRPSHRRRADRRRRGVGGPPLLSHHGRASPPWDGPGRVRSTLPAQPPHRASRRGPGGGHAHADLARSQGPAPAHPSDGAFSAFTRHAPSRLGASAYSR